MNCLVDALAPVCTVFGLTVPLPAGYTDGVIVVWFLANTATRFIFPVFGCVSVNAAAVLKLAPPEVLRHATKCQPAFAVAVNARVDAEFPDWTPAGLVLPLPAGYTDGVMVVIFLAKFAVNVTVPVLGRFTLTVAVVAVDAPLQPVKCHPAVAVAVNDTAPALAPVLDVGLTLPAPAGFTPVLIVVWFRVKFAHNVALPDAGKVAVQVVIAPCPQFAALAAVPPQLETCQPAAGAAVNALVDPGCPTCAAGFDGVTVPPVATVPAVTLMVVLFATHVLHVPHPVPWLLQVLVCVPVFAPPPALQFCVCTWLGVQTCGTVQFQVIVANQLVVFTHDTTVHDVAPGHVCGIVGHNQISPPVIV